MSLVPSLMVFIAKHPLANKYDLSSIKEIVCGAAPLSPLIEEEVKQKLNLPSITKGYGMTETTVVCVSTTLSEYKPGSVGQLGPAMLVKVKMCYRTFYREDFVYEDYYFSQHVFFLF